MFNKDFAAITSYRADSGNSTTGAFYSYGSSAADRARVQRRQRIGVRRLVGDELARVLGVLLPPHVQREVEGAASGVRVLAHYL